jgi:hypothetical protein
MAGSPLARHVVDVLARLASVHGTACQVVVEDLSAQDWAWDVALYGPISFSIFASSASAADGVAMAA